MDKFKKMTHSLKRDFTSPKKIPIGNECSVRLLGVKSNKAAHSLDDEDTANSDSLPSQDSSSSSTKKSDIVENEGKHFFKKLAVNLSLTKKRKDLKEKYAVVMFNMSRILRKTRPGFEPGRIVQ